MRDKGERERRGGRHFSFEAFQPGAVSTAMRRRGTMHQTVMIVNGNANARIIAQTLLESRGIKTHATEDAIEALDVLERHGADISLMLIDLDEMPPGMSGWELLRQVRGRFGGPALCRPPRIVVQSERRDAEAERFMHHLGAEAYLRKPTGPAELLDVVSGLLAEGEQRRPGLRFGRAV
jgi:CheY-like chemotaxis protein